ncbi:MAG: phosphorylase [Rhodocyclaceae bacterium]|nr:phosphorylase [Rhodocyclaceae bacterium]MBX3669950.1 phosphorylase [Rhodocyclaceae bacterium]
MNTAGVDFAAALETSLARAAASGALQRIETESVTVSDGGIAFCVRWLSTLVQKERAAGAPGAAQKSAADPFLPPEPDLRVADISATHVALLNKYPVIAGHLLIVTRHYAEQESVLDTADFAALAAVMQQLPGLAFFNGGRIAGASQSHKHLQFAALDPLPLAAILPHQPTPLVARQLPQLPFRHAWLALPAAAPADLAELLHSAADMALAECGLRPQAGRMRPYNLLATRDWLMAVPRRQEFFEHAGMRVPVNALGFAGSLFVRRNEDIAVVRQVGPLAVLRAVAEGD